MRQDSAGRERFCAPLPALAHPRISTRQKSTGTCIVTRASSSLHAPSMQRGKGGDSLCRRESGREGLHTRERLPLCEKRSRRVLIEALP